jgi:transcriptional regulator with XRE-family HTH domain
MAVKTPKSIKINVINEWLQGISRNKIANSNGIGAGTVTNIHQQVRNNDVPDTDLLRELAIKLKKENLDLSYFASAVRLKKVLDRIELPEEELLLEEMDVRCFRRGVQHDLNDKTNRFMYIFLLFFF